MALRYVVEHIHKKALHLLMSIQNQNGKPWRVRLHLICHHISHLKEKVTGRWQHVTAYEVEPIDYMIYDVETQEIECE